MTHTTIFWSETADSLMLIRYDASGFAPSIFLLAPFDIVLGPPNRRESIHVRVVEEG